MTTKTKTRTWVTKYGYPETRSQVEHEEDECAACQAVGGLDDGQVCYVEVERPDGTVVVRRLEGTGRVKGFFARLPFVVGWTADERRAVACRTVSREEADRELAEARARGWIHEDASDAATRRKGEE